MSFNWEISLGALISIATLIFAAGGFYFSTQNLARNLDALAKAFGDQVIEIKKTFGDQVADIRQDLKALNEVVTKVAVQGSRLDNLERRVDEQFKSLTEDIKDLKHGKGFIQA